MEHIHIPSLWVILIKKGAKCDESSNHCCLPLLPPFKSAPVERTLSATRYICLSYVGCIYLREKKITPIARHKNYRHYGRRVFSKKKKNHKYIFSIFED